MKKYETPLCEFLAQSVSRDFLNGQGNSSDLTMDDFFNDGFGQSF